MAESALLCFPIERCNHTSVGGNLEEDNKPFSLCSVCYCNDYIGTWFFLFSLPGKVCADLILQATTIRWKRSSSGEVIGIIYVLPIRRKKNQKLAVSLQFFLPEDFSPSYQLHRISKIRAVPLNLSCPKKWHNEREKQHVWEGHQHHPP